MVIVLLLWFLVVLQLLLLLLLVLLLIIPLPLLPIIFVSTINQFIGIAAIDIIGSRTGD